MSDAHPGAGNIEIELDGEARVMTPSLVACMAISNLAGGLNSAAQRCLQLDMDTICQIVIAGLGLNQNQSKLIPELVYRTGLMQLAGPCVDFINIVGNGGRPLGDDQPEDNPKDPTVPASV